LPTAVLVNDKEYGIEPDFRTCIRIILAFEDDGLAPIEKKAVLIENLYLEQPDNLPIAFSQGIKFLNGGEDAKEDEGSGVGRLYSFQKDANFIFAAFRQTHGIDLENENMHWWKFLALFADLGADTTFCNLINLRKKIKTGTASKEEKATARELGDLMDIPEPDTRTLEEKEIEQEFMRQIRGI